MPVANSQRARRHWAAVTFNFMSSSLRQWYFCLCDLGCNALLHAQQLAPPRCEQAVETRPCRRADRESRKRSLRFDRREIVFAEQIHLRENHAVRTPGQLLRMRRDFMTELIVFGLPVHRIDRNQERQKARALDVAQELETESLPLMRTLDDARNVSDHESPVI